MLTVSPTPDQLPEAMHKFFWDVNPAKVNPAKSPHYVINRLLDKGDLEAARWVLRHYPKETIKDTFRKIRDFSPWTGTFWSNYLDIPREEVACLETHYREMRKKLWPY